MFRQVSLAAVVATTTFTALTKSHGKTLSDTSSNSTVGAISTGSDLKSLRSEKFAVGTDFHQRPGVFAWGSNKWNVISNDELLSSGVVKTPTRLTFFDGKILRDLALSEKIGVAILENGDVVQWNSAADEASGTVDKPQNILRGKNIVKIRISAGNSVYALSNSGIIYSWKTAQNIGDYTSQHQHQKNTHWCALLSCLWRSNNESESPIISKIQSPQLSFREYIKDIEVGNDHILALSSKGRVFSGSTGYQRPPTSKGQYGIASMSQFDDAPVPGKLHQIKLLEDYSIGQIATGAYHSLVLTKDGKVFGFGDNLYGQLGISYSYRTANVAVPTQLILGDGINKKVTGIAAGGSISYFTVKDLDKPETISGAATETFSMGNGIAGQLGTGSFANSQSSPLKIKYFSDLTEYSEKLDKNIPINISTWSVSPTHTSVILDNDQQGQSGGHDVLIWGSNEYSQLGNGKRNITAHPKSIPDFDNNYTKTNSQIGLQLANGRSIEFKNENGKTRKAKVDQMIVCGENITAVYYRLSK